MGAGPRRSSPAGGVPVSLDSPGEDARTAATATGGARPGVPPSSPRPHDRGGLRSRPPDRGGGALRPRSPRRRARSAPPRVPTAAGRARAVAAAACLRRSRRPVHRPGWGPIEVQACCRLRPGPSWPSPSSPTGAGGLLRAQHPVGAVRGFLPSVTCSRFRRPPCRTRPRRLRRAGLRLRRPRLQRPHRAPRLLPGDRGGWRWHRCGASRDPSGALLAENRMGSRRGPRSRRTIGDWERRVESGWRSRCR